jgi:hypothetical protein
MVRRLARARTLFAAPIPWSSEKSIASGACLAYVCGRAEGVRREVGVVLAGPGRALGEIRAVVRKGPAERRRPSGRGVSQAVSQADRSPPRTLPSLPKSNASMRVNA